MSLGNIDTLMIFINDRHKNSNDKVSNAKNMRPKC